MSNLVIILNDREIIFSNKDLPIKLTTSEANNTCIYINLVEDKIIFTGGSSIIGAIEGEGMSKKVKENRGVPL